MLPPLMLQSLLVAWWIHNGAFFFFTYNTATVAINEHSDYFECSACSTTGEVCSNACVQSQQVIGGTFSPPAEVIHSACCITSTPCGHWAHLWCDLHLRFTSSRQPLSSGEGEKTRDDCGLSPSLRRSYQSSQGHAGCYIHPPAVRL